MKPETPKIAVSPTEIAKIIESTQQTIDTIEKQTDNAKLDLKEYQEELEYLRSIMTFQTRLIQREKENQFNCAHNSITSYGESLLNNVALSSAQERIQYLEQEIPNIHQRIADYQHQIISLHTDIKLLREISSHRLTKENKRNSIKVKSRIPLIGRHIL